MIKLENITLLDKKTDSEPINFSCDKGVTHIAKENKNIFKVLSIRQQYIKDGSLSIGDFSLYPLSDQKKYAFVLAINSQVIDINAVFVLDLSFKDKTRTFLKKDLVALRDLPLTNDEEKLVKINKILEIVKAHDAAYILIDSNDSVNHANMELINKALQTHLDLTTLIMDEIPQVAKQPVVKTKKVSKAKDDKFSDDNMITPLTGDDILNSEKEENVTVTCTMPVLDDEEFKQAFETFEKEFSTFNIDIAYKKASDKKEADIKSGKHVVRKGMPSRFLVFMKELFKMLYLYFLFTGLFSIFLSVCSFTAIYLIKNDDVLIAGILLFLDVVFVVMHFYIIGSTYAGIRNRFDNMNQKIIFVVLFMLFTILGLGIGLGIIFLLSSQGIFIDISKYVMGDWILGIVISIIAILSPIASSPLAWLYIKIHNIFVKLFPNKDEED